MKLKQYLFSQNICVLLITVVVTACFSLMFGYFSLRLQGASEEGESEQRILVHEENILHNATLLSEYQVRELLLNVKMGIDRTEIGGRVYHVEADVIHSAEGNYTLLGLAPYVDLSLFYRKMIFVVIAVFLITFLASCMVVQHLNMKQIVLPLLYLRTETEKLMEGDLDTEIADEGCGEVNELTQTVETLRLRLRDTVNRQKRYDDNRKFLTSSISHDLKTPVTAVRGYIEGVLDGVADTAEKQRSYLTKAVDKTILISNMIDDLLLYSKLELNQLPFDLERVDIARYLSDCAEDCQSDFAKENKQLVLENSLADSVFVQIDLRRFRRVVQNITDNAKKHIAEDTGCLKILLRETEKSVIIEFADNGEGISPEDLPHIFERFYRADSARRAEGSSGLGLAIAKQIVTGMEGRIWAVSEEEKGSSIMVLLKKLSIIPPEEERKQF